MFTCFLSSLLEYEAHGDDGPHLVHYQTQSAQHT